MKLFAIGCHFWQSHSWERRNGSAVETKEDVVR